MSIVFIAMNRACEMQWHATGARSKVYCHPLRAKGEFPARDQWRSSREGEGTSEFDAERGNSMIRGPWHASRSTSASALSRYRETGERHPNPRTANGASLDSIAIIKFMVGSEFRGAILSDVSIVGEVPRR